MIILRCNIILDVLKLNHAIWYIWYIIWYIIWYLVYVFLSNLWLSLFAGTDTCWACQPCLLWCSSWDFSFCPRVLAGLFRRVLLRRLGVCLARSEATRTLTRSMTASRAVLRKRRKTVQEVSNTSYPYNKQTHLLLCFLFFFLNQYSEVLAH